MKTKRSSKLLLLAAFALVLSISQAVAADSPRSVGVNLSGPEFGTMPGVYGTNYFYPTASDADWAKGKGLELIRLPFRWQRVQPTIYGALDSSEVARMDAFLDFAEARGLRVILDMHDFAARTVDSTSYKIGSAGLPVTAFQDVWGKLAAHFADRGCIWGYDIMNEPVGVTIDDWVPVCQAVVTTIRSVDMNHSIILEGVSYAKASSWATTGAPLLAVVDPAAKLIFSAHSYPDNDSSGTWTHGGTMTAELVPSRYPDLASAYNVAVDRVQPFVEWCVANGVPGLLGEFGVPATTDAENWAIVLDRLLAYLESNNISATQWGGGKWWSATYTIKMQPRKDNSDPLFMATVQDYALGAGSNFALPFTWYGDAIAPGFTYAYAYAYASAGSTGAVTTVDTSTFYAGTASFHFNYTILAGGYAGGGMHVQGGIDLRNNFAAGHVLSFYAKGSAGANIQLTFSRVDSSGNSLGSGTWVSLANLVPLSATWHRYEIPLSAFTNAQITGQDLINRILIAGTSADGVSHDVYLDQITIGLASTATAPVVTVDTSTGANAFVVGQNVALVAAASDADLGDMIDHVEFYADHQMIGITATAPYTWTTTFSTAGDYAVTAIAFDQHGVVTQSAAKLLTVSSEMLLEQSTTSGWREWITSTQVVGQSFSHGSLGGPNYSVSKIKLRLSRDPVAPNAPINFSIGTTAGGGALAGSAFTITPASVTDASGGATYMDYVIEFPVPVGPLTSGATYYLNLDATGITNGKIYKVQASSTDAYAKGQNFQNGVAGGLDLVFEVWGL